MAKHKEPVDKPEGRRIRKPDPGLSTCDGCGGAVTYEGTLRVSPMGQPHDCATALIWWSVRWGRPRNAEKPCIF